MDDPGQMSAAARSVWAKSFPFRSASPTHWTPLWQHLDDTAGIAALLWDAWTPEALKSLLGRNIGSVDAARSLAIWLAAIHDIGKVSPAFAVQSPSLASAMAKEGLATGSLPRNDEIRRQIRHEIVAYVVVNEWLIDQQGFSRSQAENLASIVASHHGRPPDASQIVRAAARRDYVGDDEWVRVREELLTRASRKYLDAETLEVWREAKLSQPIQLLLSAQVIVADWLASSQLFPMQEVDFEGPSLNEARVDAAWRALAFPRPWAAKSADTEPTLQLHKRFGLPPHATLLPAQASFVQAARGCTHPELLILEAEMGSGKTEAALLAAEILAEKFGLGGIYLGLPTQATTDAMFERLLPWVESLKLERPADVQLVRQRSYLQPTFAGLPRYGGIYDECEKGNDLKDSGIFAHRWFSEPRRGPLANFVVGTVDQALVAGLRTRFVMLRHLALASKVVVIDEVHSYDTYMNVFLEALLEWLGAYGTPVILLSATLSSRAREDLVSAYERGRAAPPDRAQLESLTPRMRRSLSSQGQGAKKPIFVGDSLASYPKVTVTDFRADTKVLASALNREERCVKLEFLGDGLPELMREVSAAVAEGAAVAVIRNTVTRAQETALLLRAVLGDDKVMLAHARFAAIDRANRDQKLLARFGKLGRGRCGQVVVATQVIEQSLDIDFDLMFSDLAPIDLLFQRIGRLHRHEWLIRPRSATTARLVLTGVDVSHDLTNVPVPVSGPYDRAILLHTLAALRGRDELHLPSSIYELVESVYSSDLNLVPSEWRDEVERAHGRYSQDSNKRKQNAAVMRIGEATRTGRSLIGFLKDTEADPESDPRVGATVRDGDAAVEVALLQQTTNRRYQTFDKLAQGGGIAVQVGGALSAEVIQALLGSAIRLPRALCHPAIIEQTLGELKAIRDTFSWPDVPAMRHQYLLVLDESGSSHLSGFTLRYTPELGLTHSPSRGK